MSEPLKIILTGDINFNKFPYTDKILDKLKESNINAFALKSNLSDGLSCEKLTEFFVEEEKKFSGDSVLLIEQGLMYGRKFAGETKFNNILKQYGLSDDIIRNSYDAVFFFKTKDSDDFLLSLWAGTEHLRIIDLSDGFEKSLQKLKKEVFAVLGIPEPLEIERKFLIEYPDLEFLNSLKTCRKVPITQTYLKTPTEGKFRVRKRGSGENCLYIKTVKRKISDIKRIEIENYISKEEYERYLQMNDCVIGTISKDRYCIAFDTSYFELDVFPFWSDKAVIEIELLSENEDFKFPEFVKIIKEVSSDPYYRNIALAKIYANK